MTISKYVCCEKTLEILLKNVKSVEDLDLIAETVIDYQNEFGVDLTKYFREIEVMKGKYLFKKRQSGGES
ncbi:MAG: hypothetical protein AABY22_07675 [Nanoarchaeota archaeon]